MTEPCDLTAVEARQPIGRRKLAPTQLLESCISRIETVDHAVNAMVARDFDRARQEAKAAVARGDATASRPAQTSTDWHSPMQ
jgi:amidase